MRITTTCCDTHTAVAVKVYEDYKKATGDDTKTVIASTANPYKFSGAVYEAIGGTPVEDEWKNIAELEAKTGTKMPAPLAATKNKEIRLTAPSKSRRCLKWFAAS